MLADTVPAQYRSLIHGDAAARCATWPPLDEELERAKREDPPAVQFLTDKQFARETLHLVHHLTARIEEETELRQTGGGEITNDKWIELREIVSEIEPAVSALTRVIRFMLDDEGDWVDVEDLKDDDVLEIEDAEVLELEIGEIDPDGETDAQDPPRA